ncbi:MAG TPA: hypothetical protein VGN12_17390 [Pirellulales bacterium]|jgi:diadenosine tetraphosphate (Ap4A) HIT family hydrolase
MAPEPQWTVDIEELGRCGLIHYRERENSALFDWEFAAAPAVVLIWPRDANQWEQIHPWAFGRKVEIMENVARDVCRQKAPACSFKIDEANSLINIFEPSKNPTP